MNDPHQTGFEQGLAGLPEPLRRVAHQHWAEIAPQLVGCAGDGWQVSAAKVLACSEFVLRTCQARPDLLAELLTSGDLQRADAVSLLTSRVRLI